MIHEVFEDLRGFAGRDDEVQVANNLFLSSIAACDFTQDHGWMPAQIFEETFGESHHVAKAELTDAASMFLDSGQNVLRLT